MDSQVRLNKFLAEQLGISRREADERISAGHVQINGIRAELGSRVHPNDKVLVNDKPITATTALQYIALHKPAGYVCSRKQQGNAPTIYELLPEKLHHLKPVGRLDKDSSGIILLTNDGTFAHQMTHPSFAKQKVYYVTLNAALQPLHQQMISDHGIMLEDGGSRLQVHSLYGSPEKPRYPAHTYRVEMSEGRNRQIRRTFAALGYEVTGLHRTEFGSYQLDTLKRGEWQAITRR